jgi:hypothetical protein
MPISARRAGDHSRDRSDENASPFAVRRNYLVPWTGPAYPNEFVGFNSRYPTDSSNQVVGIGNTYTLNPTLVNEFHASFTRQILAVNESALGDVMNVPAVEKQLAPLKIPSRQFYPVPTWQMSSPGGGNL